jgi:hypothetical protein
MFVSAAIVIVSLGIILSCFARRPAAPLVILRPPFDATVALFVFHFESSAGGKTLVHRLSLEIEDVMRREGLRVREGGAQRVKDVKRRLPGCAAGGLKSCADGSAIAGRTFDHNQQLFAAVEDGRQSGLQAAEKVVGWSWHGLAHDKDQEYGAACNRQGPFQIE